VSKREESQAPGSICIKGEPVEEGTNLCHSEGEQNSQGNTKGGGGEDSVKKEAGRDQIGRDAKRGGFFTCGRSNPEEWGGRLGVRNDINRGGTRDKQREGQSSKKGLKVFDGLHQVQGGTANGTGGGNPAT